MVQNCIFCKIIEGKSYSTTVYHDDQIVAFLDINPAAPVHILIVPREHIPTINHLTSELELLIGRMVTVAKRLAYDNGIAETGYRLIINTGPDAHQAVFHLHLHLLGGRPMRFPMG
jgi:histidine triad (HIT) family protein